jgi:uncharacterized membrane-anchored protein YhcB (DUF1043 family)
MEISTVPPHQDPSLGAEISDYVAHLQLHMALQARNLVPDTLKTSNQMQVLLHETQAHCEKLSSRQGR